jgi:hypothetical protein
VQGLLMQAHTPSPHAHLEASHAELCAAGEARGALDQRRAVVVPGLEVRGGCTHANTHIHVFTQRQATNKKAMRVCGGHAAGVCVRVCLCTTY